MPPSNELILAFDLYGTLLSTSSIAKSLEAVFGKEIASPIAAAWRKCQLEYTWRLNSMNQYQPFSAVTHSSLLHAIDEVQGFRDYSSAHIDELMSSYDSLSAFPDVGSALAAISQEPTIAPVIFSNGTHSMLESSLRSSPDLSPHASLFKKIVSVEPVRKFKPHPEVYRHLTREVNKEGKEEEVWLVSGNAFDVVGAKAVGMRAVWVDRGGKGWQDALIEGDVGRPDVIVTELGEVVGKVRAFG